jgi:multiple sugar transport system substrate-binding protein
MTFEEVLELAGRFADNQIENTVVGFYKPGVSPARLLFFVGDMEGLQWLDPNERKITLNTQAWSHLFSYLIDAYKSGAVVDASLTGNGFNNGRSPTDYSQIIEQSRQRNLFVAGKAAMTIDSPLLINDINRVNPDMKWDLVTLPASKNSPAPSHLIQFQTIYAIHSESSNAELSWKLIQFMNSDEVAKMKSGTSRLDDKLPLRMKYLPDMNGKKLEAFYMLNTEDRPVSTTVIPAQFYQTFYSIVDEEIANVLNERTPISEALRIIQEKGSLELLNALSNP